MAASPEESVALVTRVIDFYRDITKGDHEPATNLRDLLTASDSPQAEPKEAP